MPTTVPLVLNLSADEYLGDAMANVSLDGVAGPQNIDVSALHSTGAVQAVALGQVDPTVAHIVVVTFQQDAWGGDPSKDRNLYVVSYTLGTQTVAVGHELNVAGDFSFATAPQPVFASEAELAADTVDAGTYTDAVDFPLAVTLKGASGTASGVVFDGQGGYTQGHRLAYGKAVHHLSAACTIQGVSYRNAGGLPYDASYENQAGVYAEGFTGTVTLSNLALDGCNDGIFVPSATSAPGSAVSVR